MGTLVVIADHDTDVVTTNILKAIRQGEQVKKQKNNSIEAEERSRAGLDQREPGWTII